MPKLPPETPILVVDDSSSIRARMESYLSTLGYTNVRTASDIEEAVKAFHEQDSQVVFLDLVIGEQRGPDFAMQALTERPFTNVILMTALPSSHEFVTTSIAEGARDFLSKPIRLSSLEQVLDRIALTPEEERDRSEKKTHENVSYG